ncbi:MAG: SDR family oxidoreductase [Deltaproteobacteria bacterium]|nr:SDR family oxidoreductase [Deltaproteobacteria bacterium]
MDLKHTVVLVTGAARRVGGVTALTLARAGAKIVVHYHRSRVEAVATVRAIEDAGSEAIAVQADQTKPAQIRRAVATAIRHFGRIDVLVNNASIFERTPFDAITMDDWERHLYANVIGPFFFARAVADGMRRRRRGKIINIADWAALKPYPGYIPYCASKAALLNTTVALAKTLAPHIQVNAICPGPVMWPEDLAASEQGRVKKKTLLRRLGTPEDVAQAVRYLIEAGDYVTGTSLVVDGGRLVF